MTLSPIRWTALPIVGFRVCSAPGMARLIQTERSGGLAGFRADLVSAMANIVGDDNVSTSRADRIAYSADFWPKAQIWKMAGEIERFPPDCIAWPASAAEVAAILAYCHEHQVPVVPYGGGSGVCGGTIPVRGGVVVDVKRMRRVRSIDPVSMTVSVEAGANGQHLEDTLNVAGFTLGHFPSSIMCSTVGGWLAARSGGQFSSKYGKIEDMVLGLEVALAAGEILDTTYRAPGAPDWTQLIVGSEGTLGIILGCELKIRPLPDARRFRAWRFRHLEEGFKGMRAVMQAGLKPIVLRLYDPFDSLIALGKEHDDPGAEMEGPMGALRSILKHATRKPMARLEKALHPLSRAAKRGAMVGGLMLPGVTNRLANAAPSPCLMITGFEGGEAEVIAESYAASEILLRQGATDAGSRIGEAWLAKRYAVGFKQTKLMNMGAWVDTMEVATTWDRLEGLYSAVRKAVTPHAFIMAHFSHAYREGASIYFTMAGHRRDAGRAEQHYERTWEHAIEAVLGAGATLSHHHGVGLHKMAAMGREHGHMVKAWRALKTTLDPHGIMNPGKLFPDEVADTAEDDTTALPPAVGAERGDAAGGRGGKTIHLRPEAAGASLIEELRSIVPAEQIETQHDGEPSAGGAWAIEPAAQVELSEILKWANQRHAAVFTRRPRRGDAERCGLRPRIYLRSRRMRRVLDTDIVSGTVTVQTGISMAELHKELEERSFTTGLPTRPWRQEPLGAVLAAILDAHWGPRFGSMETEVLGLGLIFPDGTVAHSKAAPRKAVGPDFDRLFLGSRGRFGILHEVTLRIYPNVTRAVHSFGAPSLSAAIAGVQRAIASGLDPRAFELLTPAHDRAWGKKRVGLNEDLPVLVLVEPWVTGTAGDPKRLMGGGRELDSLIGPDLVRLEPPVGWNVHEGLLPSPRAWTAPVVPARMSDLVRLAEQLGRDVPPGLWIVRMSRHGGYLSIADGANGPAESDGESNTGATQAFVAEHLPATMARARAWHGYQRGLEQRLDPKGILNPDG